MAIPAHDPDSLDPTQVTPTATYRPADPVWVFRSGNWQPGVIVAASTRAATVTYRPVHSRGTAVDTLMARYLTPRVDVDPLLDGTPQL